MLIIQVVMKADGTSTSSVYGPAGAQIIIRS